MASKAKRKQRSLSNHLLLNYLGNQTDKDDSSSSVYSHTFDDDNNEFEELLNPSHLEMLDLQFKSRSNKDAKIIVEYCMGMDEFHNVNMQLLSIYQYGERKKAVLSKGINELFKKVDVKSSGSISWDDLCTYIMLHSNEDDPENRPSTALSKPRIVKFATLKDSFAKLLVDCNSSRYISASKEGKVNILSSDLSVVKSFHIEQFGEVDPQSLKRRTKLWVTDCVCIPEINKLIVSTANRDIRFFDMSTTNITEQFILYALPNIALCLCCYYQKQLPYGKCYLFFGTDSGDVHLLLFLMPNNSLFETPFKKSGSGWKILYSDLGHHSRCVSHDFFPHLHSDWVKRIKYNPESDVMLSCSNNPKDSLVYRSIDESKRKVYVFKVTKGIECFDYNKTLSLLATGGVDHILRLWDPYVTSKPMAILKTHQTSIIDIVIYEPSKQVFSYSKDGSGHTLLIAAEDCIAEFKFSLDAKRRSIGSTHSASVVAVLHIPRKDQVVSVSEDGEKIVWDLFSGKQILTMKKGSHEISTAAIDENGEYLVTGSRDGLGQVWDLSTGVEEKRLEAYMATEITCIVVVPLKHIIFMVGWSRKLLAYYDRAQAISLKADKRWLAIHAHKDDIMSAVYFKPHFLCTSSFDGEVIMWNIERCKLAKKIQINTGQLFKSRVLTLGIVRKSAISTRSSARQRQSAKRLSQPDCYSVDILLCLTHRPTTLIVAVEGCTIRFWSVITATKPVASFAVSNKPNLFVMALASDPQNKYLMVGDSKGTVYVYDIRRYAMVKKFSDLCVSTNYSVHHLETVKDSPILLNTWTVHEDEAITCLTCFKNGDDLFLLTACTDCVVCLWTFDGHKVGLFNEGKPMLSLWLEQLKEYRITSSGTSNEKQPVTPTDEGNRSEMKKEKNDCLLPSLEQTEGVPCKTSPIVTDIEKLKSTEVYKTRSLINEDINDRKDNWSVLGDSYHSSFNQRMKNRNDRRINSEVDEKSLHECGGLNNLCSPFKALLTLDMEDYSLPAGMPITPRMINKSINPYNATSLENIQLISN